MPHVVPPTDGPHGARSWSSAAGRRHGGGPGRRAARPRGGAARGHRPPGRPGQSRGQGAGPRGDRRHRRLARGASSSSWASTSASTATPRPTRSWPWPPTWSSSPPAACPTRASCERARIWSPASGTCWAAMSSPPAACCSTTTMAGTRARRPPCALAKKGVQVELVDARPHAGVRGRRHQLPQLSARALPARRSSCRRTWSCARSAATATGSSPASGTMYAEAAVERVVDHVVVEHGTLPADELYHALKAGSRNGGQSTSTGSPRAAPAELIARPRRQLRPLPRRRRRRQPQHPRRDLRLAAADEGPLGRRAGSQDRATGSRRPVDFRRGREATRVHP